MKDVPQKKTQARARRNVTIPKTVDDAMRQHPEVNWSVVAADAFKYVLKNIGRGER